MSNDTFSGTNGNNIFNGGSGSDTVTFAGNASDYRIETLQDGRIKVTDLNKLNGNTGVDILTGIEILCFEDKDYTLNRALTNGPQGEVLINTTTAGDQNTPAIAALADGGFIVTWASDGQDGSSYGIYAQRYDTQGNAVGGETLINTETLFSQGNPTVTALDNGGYIIAWEAWYHDGDPMSGIYLQRFDANGNPVGVETHVNTHTDSDQTDANIVALADGAYVLTWTSIGQEAPDGEGNPDVGGVYAQRYDALGNRTGGEVHVNTYTDNSQNDSSITALDDGGYLIVWASYAQDAHSGLGVYARRYDALGNAVGGETLINTYVNSYQGLPSIATLSDGGYVISWSSYDQEGTDTFYGIYAQRFDASGTAVGVETHVNTSTANWEQAPTIAGLADGGFVIAWQSGTDINGSEGDIYAQRFDANGDPVGGETLINSTSILNQIKQPEIAALADGGYVVSWETTNEPFDIDNGEIYAQRFDAEGNPWGPASLKITGTAAVDTLNGGTGNQTLEGLAGNDTLNGGAGTDILLGNNGADLLIGGRGSNALSGGFGADTFRFQIALGASVDKVRDFTDSDTLQLDNAIFTQLADGSLSAANFAANATGAAVDGNDFLVYNTTSGNLYYDADGSGAGAAVRFAVIVGVPALSAADFDVI